MFSEVWAGFKILEAKVVVQTLTMSFQHFVINARFQCRRKLIIPHYHLPTLGLYTLFIYELENLYSWSSLAKLSVLINVSYPCCDTGYQLLLPRTLYNTPL